MAIVGHPKAALEVWARSTPHPATAQRTTVLKWISLSITNVPMQDNACQQQEANGSVVHFKTTLKILPGWAVTHEHIQLEGVAQQCKLIQSHNCHSWECQEEVYNGSAVWL